MTMTMLIAAVAWLALCALILVFNHGEHMR